MEAKKPTLVIAISTSPPLYARMAIKLLREHGHPVVAFGVHPERVADIDIETIWNPAWDVDTVTLYVNPRRQGEWIPKILELEPKRVIFNPGTENQAFIDELVKKGIEAEVACTLVLLHTDQY